MAVATRSAPSLPRGSGSSQSSSNTDTAHWCFGANSFSVATAVEFASALPNSERTESLLGVPRARLLSPDSGAEAEIEAEEVSPIVEVEAQVASLGIASESPEVSLGIASESLVALVVVALSLPAETDQHF
jgi:hypothetical protein